MSNIIKKFNSSSYGIIVSYQRHYEVHATPAKDGGILLEYRRSGESKPLDSDGFDTIEQAADFIISELKGVGKIRTIAAPEDSQ